MQRFDQAALLDRLAAEGALEVATIEALAVEIAGFHARAEARTGHGGHAGMRAGDRRQCRGPRRPCRRRLRARRGRGSQPAHARRARARRRAARRARRGRQGPPLPWRSPPRQHRAVGRAAGAVRLPRVRPGARDHRRPLRPRVPPDGPLPPRPAAARAAPAQRLPRCHLGRCGHGAAAAVPLGARRDPRQGRRLHRARTTPKPGPRRAPTSSSRRRFLDPAPPRLVAIGGVSGTGKTTLARRLAPFARPRAGRRAAAQRHDPQEALRRRADRAPARRGLRRARLARGLRAPDEPRHGAARGRPGGDRRCGAARPGRSRAGRAARARAGRALRRPLALRAARDARASGWRRGRPTPRMPRPRWSRPSSRSTPAR